MKIGVITHLRDADADTTIAKVRSLGIDYCQLGCWNHSILTPETAEAVKAACEKYNVKISTVWVGWSGPKAWNFTEGPITLGIVPPDYRYERCKELMHGSDFAKLIGVDQIATHMGFLPENPTDPQYAPVVAAIKMVANHCKANGQRLLFETGQETPVTILRVIEDTGCDNLGVNLDPANLIMYGKANPVDALTVFGRYVYDVHGKDGKYPTDGKNLGHETPIGDGAVNFPLFIAKLKEIGYDGCITIEREISGEEQIKDILKAKKILEELF